MKLELRPYQREALERIAAAEDRGVRRQLGVAATGLGKTIVFSALAEQRRVRTLILAHRDELVNQAVEKIRQVWPDVDVGVVKGTRNEVDHEVVVASVQTLARPNRLGAVVGATDDVLWSRREPFGLVVVDEAHHAAADSYRRILDATAGALVLGVTATPDRGDGKGLDDLFDEIVFSYDILWGIRSGFLCDVRGLRVTLHDLDLTGVKTRGGDYAEGELGRRLDDAGAPLATVMAWMEHALGRRTLVFCPTVDLAQKTAAEFAIAGVKVGFVSGETPIDERRAVLAAYSAGDIDVVVNCAVLTEGYDEPRTDCIIVARPTKSRALYTQMIGRGTRRHPEKTDLLVLDLVGASAHHSLCTIPSLFGTGAEEFDGKLGDGSGRLTEVIDEWEREQVRQGRLTAEEADLFRQMRTEIAWVAVHEAGAWPRRYERALGKGEPRVVVTQPDADSGWWCWLTYPPGTYDSSAKGGVHILISDVDLETAQGVGEDWLRKSGKMGLVASDAPWRSRKPSAKQLGAAKKFRVPVAPGMTAGEVSDAIDAAIQRLKASGKWRNR